MHIHRLLLTALTSSSLFYLAAQPVDDTQLKQVIIFGRHSVRSPVAPTNQLNTFSVKPVPDFGVAGPGILTDNGKKLEAILGGYYRLWLIKEGLLSGNDLTDSNFVYFRANVLERTIDTAKAFAAGMLPAAAVTVNFYGPQESDPLFDPVGAGVADLDYRKALAAVQGRAGGNGESLASAYAPELALTRSVLFDYPLGQTPPPATPKGLIDVTSIPIEITLGDAAAGSPVNFGGLTAIGAAIDPFLMEYADGLPVADVGWGQMTLAGISQTLRIYNLWLDLLCRTPYLASVESANLASHVMRSMVQAATGNATPGSLADPLTRVIVLIASDTHISGLAGLFRLDWILPGYQMNSASPGGALIFELRQSQSTGEYIVRATYVAQTLDQLRNRTTLTLAAPPASAPLFIPGCSSGNSTFDCSLTNFVKVAKGQIDLRFVQ